MVDRKPEVRAQGLVNLQISLVSPEPGVSSPLRGPQPHASSI